MYSAYIHSKNSAAGDIASVCCDVHCALRILWHVTCTGHPMACDMHWTPYGNLSIKHSAMHIIASIFSDAHPSVQKSTMPPIVSARCQMPECLMMPSLHLSFPHPDVASMLLVCLSPSKN